MLKNWLITLVLVSRIRCRGENYEMDLTLDIANELYPLRADDRFHCVLSAHLTLGGPNYSSSNSSRGGVGGATSLSGTTTTGSTSTTPAATGSALEEEATYDPAKFSGDIPNLADRFDYVMHGRIYKAEEATLTKVALYISFGGLLMRLEGDPRHWRDLKVGNSVYILMKKI